MTIALRELLNDPNFSYRLDEVRNVLDKTQASVTFWGTRVVRVNGDNTSVILDRLAKKVVETSIQRSFSHDLILSDRIAGLDITNTLQGFYKMTDQEKDRACFLTKLFVYFRELSFAVVTTRKYIEGFKPDGISFAGCSVDFRYFCNSDYKKQFNCDLPENDDNAEQSSLNSWTIIKESVIRDLWEKSHINTGTD